MQVDNTSDDKPKDLAHRLQWQHQDRAGVKLKLFVRRALLAPHRTCSDSHRQFIEIDALIKRMVVSATTCREQHLLHIATSFVVECHERNDRVETVSGRR